MNNLHQQNARNLAIRQAQRDASEPRSFWDDDDESPSMEECDDEAKRLYAAEGYPATVLDVEWRARRLFEGEEKA